MEAMTMPIAIQAVSRAPLVGGPFWFAIVTSPRCEEQADESLKRLGYMTFYPFTRERKRRKIPGMNRYRVEWVEEPYFPGYIFAAIRYHGESLYEIDDADGVRTVWRPGKRPMHIPSDLMDELMQLGDKGEMPLPSDRREWAEGKKFTVAAGHAFAGFVARMSDLAALDKSGVIKAWTRILGSEREVAFPAWAVGEVHA